MTALALFQLSGRLSLLLFGLLSIWVAVWFTLVYDRLPQNQRWRGLNTWSRRERIQIFVLSAGFGVALIVAALKVPTTAFSAIGGDIVVCSSPFFVVGAIACIRMTIVELRLASRLRRQQTLEQGAQDR